MQTERRSLHTQYQVAKPGLKSYSKYRLEILFQVWKTAMCERILSLQLKFILSLQVPLGLKRYFRPLWDGSIRLGHLFSSPTLNNPDIPALLHRSSGSRSSSNIAFAPSSLALSCLWEVLQDLGSDHLPIFLFVPLSPVFLLNERPLPLIFRKLAGMTLLFILSPTVHPQRNTHLFLFPLLLLSLPL